MVCATFLVIGLQATCFMGEKSGRLKTQFRAEVKIETLCEEINFIVVPTLIRECIFGIDAQLTLNAVISIWRNFINFKRDASGEGIEISYKTKRAA